MSRKAPRALAGALTGLIVSVLCFSIPPAAAGSERPALEPAVRLTGVLRDGKVVSLTSEPLTVVLPLSVKERVLEEGEGATGYLLELLDGESAVALRTRLEELSVVVMEYEDPEVPGRIVNKELYPKEVPFSIIVPAPLEARTIRFLRIQPRDAAVPAADAISEDLGSFPLPERQEGNADRDEGGAP